MIRTIYMTGTVVLGLLLIGTQPAARHRMVTSAANFQQYFNDFKSAGAALGPVERFVFSVVLASTNPSSQASR
jgi:hypothetical protein